MITSESRLGLAQTWRSELRVRFASFNIWIKYGIHFPRKTKAEDGIRHRSRSRALSCVQKAEACSLLRRRASIVDAKEAGFSTLLAICTE